MNNKRVICVCVFRGPIGVMVQGMALSLVEFNLHHKRLEAQGWEVEDFEGDQIVLVREVIVI